jgi:hopanoid biosynthesis associated radical SAM protein HpnH
VRESIVSVPYVQQYRVAHHIIRQKLDGRQRYPLVLMLEPLFRCNLECAGCGKIDYPEEILNRRLSVRECLSASDECGAPIVAISGGEPLIHEEMPQIVSSLIRRKKFVYLCTNGLLLRTRMNDYAPSPYLTFSVHLDGDRERHDALTCRKGVFDAAAEAIKLACRKGFRVTINCTLYEGIGAQEVSGFFDFIMSLGVEAIMVSPAYRYAQALQKDIFLMRARSINLFREVLNLGRNRKWKFNHSALFLDFLAGNQAYTCTPWGNPTRNIFGWQKPCYLLTKEGYAPTFKALIEETNWKDYGNGRNPKCANCMLHSGFEPTAVNDTFIHPLKALWVHLRGPRTHGPTTWERPISHRDPSALEMESRRKK